MDEEEDREPFFDYNDLAAKCMCFREEIPQYRGVCKLCAENKVQLQIEEPQHHHLTKIHQYSEESKHFWKNVEDMCPSWSGFSFNNNGNIEFSHPNFLALTLCSKVVNSNDIINFDKSGSIQDEKFCIIHLNLISGIFFDYWGKQESLVSKYYKLPKI